MNDVSNLIIILQSIRYIKHIKTMKTNIIKNLTVLALSITMLTACGKDNGLVGRWEFQKEVSEVHYVDMPEWDETQTTYTDPRFMRNIKFSDNGTGEAEVDVPHIPEDPPAWTWEDFRWTQVNDKLDIVNDDWHIDWKVLNVNKKELILQRENNYYLPDGTIATYYTYTCTYHRK